MSAILNPRIWRSPASDFYGDEALQAPEVYPRETLTGIRDGGFDSVWLRGRLYDLMASRVFPELNRPRADERIRNLQEVIRRGQECGVGVWLFFNEPLAIPAAHPFWRGHSEARGALHQEPFGDPFWRQNASSDVASHPLEGREMAALCVSAPLGRQFFKEAVGGLLRQLEGLAGVILITASEYHSHCWSHHVLRPTGDKYQPLAAHALDCPRCRERGAAPVVLELIGTWLHASRQMAAPCRVLAWNWSWSMWYADPQSEIVGHLPRGVELLADWERGGTRNWRGRAIPIDEYSLGYVGPSERFLGAHRAACGLPIHAKLQINTTHELATVPNLPLLPNLYDKWTGLQREGVAGVMGCWNFGCCLTLNTHAFGRFNENPARWTDSNAFQEAIAASYFGDVDSGALLAAWRRFCEAFEHYPFGFGLLYHSPINYAPAYPLDPHYRAHPMGPSWLSHAPWGDRLEDTLGDWTWEDVIASFESMGVVWNEGLEDYRRALTASTPAPEHQKHRREELGCAEMIGCHLASMIHIYRFHQWRLAAMKRLGLHAPCTPPLDDAARRILREESANCQAALPWVRADSRLGFHQEAQSCFYDAASIERKRDQLARMLGSG